MIKGILIAGAGAVGLSLALKMDEKGIPFRLVEHDKSKKTRAFDYGFPVNSVTSCWCECGIDFNLICVAVGAQDVKPCAEEIVRFFGTRLSGVATFHTSGHSPHTLLNPIKDVGGVIFGAHPYQTFPRPSAKALEGIAWGVEGDSIPEVFLELSELTDGRAFLLDGSSPYAKTYYHLSAVFASNFMNTIIDYAKGLARSAGIPARDFLEPILRATLENNLESIDRDDIPLTGPIAAEDLTGVERHLRSLESAPDIRRAYSHISIAALESANNKGIISRDFYEKALTIFNASI